MSLHFSAKSCMRTAVILLLLVGTLAFSSTASAQGLSFVLITAPHAAVGAPVQWSLTVMNNGASSATYNESVTLVAPDSTSYSVFSATITVAANSSKNITKTLTTSTYTSQLGAFQVTGTLKQSSTVLSTTTIPITIIAAPANGTYGSVGGLGPATATFGAPLTYRTVIANLGTASLTYKRNVYINLQDGTQKTIFAGPSSTLASGSNTISETTLNPSVWNNAAPGSMSIQLNVVDGSNNVLSTDSLAIVRNALPASAYYPTFTENSTPANLTMKRMMMAMPSGCASGNTDYMMGGSGLAIGDFDGDGYDDIYVVDMMGMGILYHNNHDGTFTDVTMQAMIPMVMMQSAAIWGDIDNDGLPDLLILTNDMANDGSSKPVLLHNNGPNSSGQVTFTDISAASGIPAAIGNTQNLQAATFGDYDGDGFLDLYITAHVDCNTTNSNGHLFHNNGNLTFTDRTDLLGGSGAAVINRRGLVTAFVDYNKSGRVSLFNGNDVFTGDVLFRNDGPGGTGGWIFTDVSSSSGAGTAMSDMGIAIGDYNRDGNFDMFLSNVNANVLLQNQGNGTFKNVASDLTGAHIGRTSVPTYAAGKNGMISPFTWGTGLYDFNNDGWQDAFESGGPVLTGTLFSAFFLNNQDGTFLDISPLTGTLGNGTDPMPAAVFSDFTNTGFMDILTWGMAGNAHLFMNNARSNGNPNNWLEVKLVGGCTAAGGCTGMFTNRDAIGARFVANVGSAALWRTVIDGGGVGGNSTLVQHLGLGTATQVDSLTVYWPSGKTTTLTNIPANQKITIQEM